MENIEGPEDWLIFMPKKYVQYSTIRTSIHYNHYDAHRKSTIKSHYSEVVNYFFKFVYVLWHIFILYVRNNHNILYSGVSFTAGNYYLEHFTAVED